MSSPDRHRPQTLTWLALLAMTLSSLALSEGFRQLPGLPLLVALIIWLKGTLVARYFIETRDAHPFIARVVAVFIVIPPLALVITAYFGSTLARWASL